MQRLPSLTVHEAADALRRGRVSSAELTSDYLARIERLDPHIKAFISVTAETAQEQASRADASRAAGEDGPLLGVPYALKDVIATRGLVTTAGSLMLADFRPPYDATAYSRLRSAGAVLLGKTNLDEFAMGSSTENSAFFETRNPWDLERVPGGSSGGSAAAVAAGLCPFAIGTDTGGSIRQPAALCGAVGLKPTYGRVSRYGLVAFASSLDQIGPLTRDVRDAATVLHAIAGHDRCDSTSAPLPVPDYVSLLDADLAGVRLGVLRELLSEGVEPQVAAAVEAAVVELERCGVQIEEVSLPHTRYAVPAYYLVATAEASANLARYDGVKYGYAGDAADVWESLRQTRAHGFGAEVKRRIMLGTYALSEGYHDAYYLKALKVRALIRADFDRALERVDVLVGPTSPTTAFRLGERVDDPLTMYLSDIFTIGLNLSGYCGLSLPCGLANGLPVGLQIMGRAFDEQTVLRVGYAYQCNTEWHRLTPAIDEAIAEA
jgi:aspartyl-tRNA(Asn)/glutamyl-tRNA(Gln) amidotransferase subunit A